MAQYRLRCHYLDPEWLTILNDLTLIFVPAFMLGRQILVLVQQSSQSVVLAVCNPGNCGADVVTGLSILLCQHLHLLRCAGYLPVQQLSSQPSVEALHVAVLPR